MRLAVRFTPLLLLALPFRVHAQTVDSLAFRPGQWGVEFTPVSSFSSAGVLRFRSRGSALLVDLGAGYDGNRQSAQDQRRNSTHLRLRVGHRWYRALSPQLIQFASIGPSIAYLALDGREPSTFGGLREYSVRMTTVGLFGEVGAGWLVTPHLSLAAAWSALANYERASNSEAHPENTLNWNTSRFAASAGSVTLRLGLYF